jgi:hypothetical protein
MLALRVTLPVALAAAVALGAACGDDDESTNSTSSTATTSNVGGSGAAGGQGPGGTGPGGQGGIGGAGGACVNSLPVDMTPPDKLSQTGLYTEIASKTLNPNVRQFEPQYPLWSDGAVKTRWVYLPECEPIDTTDMDDWDFPVGTRMWKQFELNGQLLETRLIHRFGPGDNDWVKLAYQWNATDSDADALIAGGTDTKGEGWSIPALDGCDRCHGPYPAGGGTPARYLGFGALQLSHTLPGVSLDDLTNEGALSNPPSGPFTVPGTPVDQDALGYLHANCGNCHNSSPNGVVFPTMDLRLTTSDTDPTQTAAYINLVNVMPALFVGQGCNYRVHGGDYADSCIHLRMNTRGNNDQMPPLGTFIVDPAGLSSIEAWIATLPPPT